VVAYHCPCLHVARLAGADDVACVAVLGLSARIEDSLPDRLSTLIDWLSRRAACVDRCFRTLRAAVIPRTALLANAGRRAFSLLHGSLLDERLRLVVQLLCLRCRGSGHGLQQRRDCDELLTRSQGRARVVDVEVGVDALADLPA
jgi:hypothetical protein